MNRRSDSERRARDADERERERVSIEALHAAGRYCGQRECAACGGVDRD